MKAYFVGKVKNNLDWYTRHIDSAMVNKLGWDFPTPNISWNGNPNSWWDG